MSKEEEGTDTQAIGQVNDKVDMLGELLGGIQGDLSAREKILDKMFEYAFDNNEKLPMMTRLKPVERMFHIFRNKAMIRLYQDWYSMFKTETWYRKDDAKVTNEICACSYLEKRPEDCICVENKEKERIATNIELVRSEDKIFDEEEYEKERKSYDALIDYLMRLYIGEAGKGREELFTAFKNLDAAEQQESMWSRIRGRAGL